MARNPVQFQKGISLNEFLSLYGTEQQCFDALYHWRWPNGFVCPNCGHDRGCQLTTHKLQQCYRCNRQTSITAGTIFEATKLPLTVTGGGKAAVERPEFRWVNTILGNIKNALCGTYHAVRPKYAQRYLAEFEYRFNRRFDLPDIIPRLVYVALRTPPMPERLLKLRLA